MRFARWSFFFFKFRLFVGRAALIRCRMRALAVGAGSLVVSPVVILDLALSILMGSRTDRAFFFFGIAVVGDVAESLAFVTSGWWRYVYTYPMSPPSNSHKFRQGVLDIEDHLCWWDPGVSPPLYNLLRLDSDLHGDFLVRDVIVDSENDATVCLNGLVGP